MSTNTKNTALNPEFDFRADYFYGEGDTRWGNTRNDRITQVSGWAIRGAESDEYDNAVPGVYLVVDIGKKHTVAVTITEQQLLGILSAVQKIKKGYKIETYYANSVKDKASWSSVSNTNEEPYVEWDNNAIYGETSNPVYCNCGSNCACKSVSAS